MLDWTGYPEDDAPYAPVPKARLYMDELATAPGKLRIAFTTEVPREEVRPHPDVQKVFDATVKLLGELGHTMIEVPRLGIDWRKLYNAQGAIAAAMFAATIDDWTKIIGREPTEDDFEPLAWSSYMAGKSVSGVQAARGLADPARDGPRDPGQMARFRHPAVAGNAAAAARGSAISIR